LKGAPSPFRRLGRKSAVGTSTVSARPRVFSRGPFLAEPSAEESAMSRIGLRRARVIVCSAIVPFLFPAFARAEDWPSAGLAAARGRLSAERSGPTFDDGRWTFALPKGVANVASPAIADGFAVVGALDGSVRAFRADDGALVWQRRLGDAVYSSPAIDRGKVFVASLDKNVYAFRLADGALAWKRDVRGLVQSSPVVFGGSVIVAAGFPRRAIVRLDALTGRTLWETPEILEQFSNASVAVASGRVVVGANGGRVYAFDFATGAPRWTYAADGVVNLSSPTIVGGDVFFAPGGSSAELYGLDLRTGKGLPGWPKDLSPVFGAPDVAGKVLSRSFGVSSIAAAPGVVALTVRADDALDTNADDVADRYLSRESVIAVDVGTIGVAWHADNGHVVASTPNLVPKFWLAPTPAFYGSPEGATLVAVSSSLAPTVRVLDLATGAEAWSAEASSPSQGSPAFANGRLVVAAGSAVHVFRSSFNHAPSPPTISPDLHRTERGLALSWTPAADPEADVVSTVIRIDDDGEVLESWDTEFSAVATETSVSLPSLEPGSTHVAFARVRDASGAMSDWSAPATFIVPATSVLVDGTLATTLEAALARAVPGTKIEMPVGLHTLAATVAVPAGVTLAGAGAGATILDGAGLAVGVRLVPGAAGATTRLRGLTISGARVGISVAGVDGVELRNVVVRGAAEAGVDVGATGSGDLVNATLVANGVAVRSAGGALRVRNSILAHNGVAFWAAQPGVISSRYDDLFDNAAPDHNVAAGVGDLTVAVAFAADAHSDVRMSGPQATTDHGDPADAVGTEPAPNGGRVNLGAFGGTADAELSAASSSVVTAAAPAGPVPEATTPESPASPREAAGCSVTGRGPRPVLSIGFGALALFAFASRRRRSGVGRLALLIVVGAGVVSGSSRAAHAATVVWAGGTGNWATGANWVGGAAPTSSDTASFTGWTVLDRSTWSVTASVGGSVSNTKDGSWSTRWTTGTNAASGQWYRIDLGSTQTFGRIVLDDTGDGSDYAPGFDVYVSSDGSTWGSAIASGTGSAPLVTINFASQTARYVKIQLNTGGTHWWSIREAFVYGTAATDETQLSRSGWTASASLNTTAAAAIDSALSTRWDTGTNAADGQWFKVDLGAATTVSRVELSSYNDNNDYPPSYTIAVSTDDSTYTTVATGTGIAFISAGFSARSARYVKVTCTSAGSSWWSIHDFQVYGTPRAANLAGSTTVAGLTLGKGTLTQGSGAAVTVSGTWSQSGGTFTGGNAAISAANLTLSGGTFSSTSNTLTVSGTFTQSGGAFSTGTGGLSCSSSNSVATVSGGTYAVGSGTSTFQGGLTVGGSGTLTMATSGGVVAIGSAKTLTVDGTLAASSSTATIQTAGGAGTYYAFIVGSTASARPTLNITGLKVKNTDTNGMRINGNASAITTFSRFDNIAFSNGTGTRLLQIYASSLFLSSNGCTFDAGAASGTTTYNVTLAGDGTSNGETRALFGGSSCATDRTPCVSYKGDDDATGSGSGTHPATDGAVVQFPTASITDTAGTLVGPPVAALDWNTFVYYSTYLAFHNANGTADRIYVRDSSGSAKYSWDAPAGDSLVGTPRFDTVGGVHYVFVATSGGKIYRLVDDTVGGSLTADTASPWNGTYYDCTCTVTSPLALDADNLYWTGTQSGTSKVWTLGRGTATPPTGSPLPTSGTVTSTAPMLWTSGDTYIFLGLAGRVSKVDVTTQSIVADNVNPGSNVVNGRLTAVGNAIYAVDDGGTLWALDAGANFGASTGTYKLWSYHDDANHASCGGVCAAKSTYVDGTQNRVYYGDQDGHVYAVKGDGSVVAGFPFRPGSSSDAFATAALYRAGIVLIGTTTGTLYVIDQNNGTGPAVAQTFKFGATTQISGISYDRGTSRYMISVADPASKDGRAFLVDATDPTPSFR
jgi:outer membrane protein assembly factor BamB